jgi:DNA polymerase-3 subunit beta
MASESTIPATRIRAGRLLGALKDVIGIVVGKDTVPILTHVLIEAGNGLIRITASDLDMEARRECASDDKGQPVSAVWCAGIVPFALTVPGKALQAILGQIDGDAMVTLTASDDVTAKSCGRLTIAAGRSRFRLNTLPSGDFPTLAALTVAHDFGMAASVLGDALHTVAHAISTEETRYYLNGVFVHAVGLDLRMATTDGHRLARLRMDAPIGAASWPDMIVPRGAVAQLAHLLTAAAKADDAATVDVECNEGGRIVSFSMPAADEGTVVLTTKVIDGTFPDYTRVIPQAPPHDLTVDRAALAEAVARVAAIASKSNRFVRFDVSGDRIELASANPELGDAVEEVPVQHDGPGLTIGFNGQYLRDVLGKIATDQVVIRWTDAEAPVRIEASGGDDVPPDPGELPRVVHVLMPVRVP